MTELKKEHYEFNTEISKLMKMIIHNFYSSKDIFLRELISNASDAIDKAKYNLINNSNELNNDILDLQIKIYTDKETKCLTIEDRGIGMNKEDVINCLGTIAKSGTEEFVKNILNNKNNNSTETNIDLIGQFGVGFYSAFLVADKVQVLTKHIDSTDNSVIVWESNSTDGYHISEIDDINFKYGTKINLFLNDEQLEFLEENKITEIVKKHSGYISHPILLLKKFKVEKQNNEINLNLDNDIKDINSDDDIEDIDMNELEQKINKEKYDKEKVDDDKDNDDNKDDKVDDEKDDDDDNNDNKVDDEKDDDDNKVDKEKDDDDKVDDDDKEKDDDNKVDDDDNKVDDDKEKDDDNKVDDDKKEDDEEYKYEFVKINSSPIWSKDPTDVSEDDYKNLYNAITNDSGSYQTYKHFKIEGDIEFSGILFIPKTPPNNLFENKKSNKNIKLYVKKVLITDECKDLFPEHFNFVCGIVDSNDLPLNASRELLQQSKVIRKINKILVRKTLEMITDLKINHEVDYNNFYDNFSKNIKLGIHEDAVNKSKLLDFLMFPTNKSNDKLISLENYISNMKEDQQGIYYIIGNTMENIKNSAFIEKLNKKDYEVLLMCDPLDEYIMQQIHEYNDRKLINVIKDDLKLDDAKNEDPNKYDDLCKKIKESLGDTISRVTVSTKLDSHPMIVTSPMGWSANMERIIKSQAMSTNNVPPYMLGQRVLEINPDHELIKKLINSDYDKNQVDILYNMALLAGGYELNNVNNFLSKLYNNL
jgi:molecular chaperone HtpG